MADGPTQIHFYEYVDGSCQGEDVVQVDVIVFPCGPGMSQIQELKSETFGVGRESGGGDEICQETSTLLSDLKKVAVPGYTYVGNDCGAHRMVFEESVKLEVAWKHQRKSRQLPQGSEQGRLEA